MWAIRRAASSVRSYGYRVETPTRCFSIISGTTSDSVGDKLDEKSVNRRMIVARRVSPGFIFPRVFGATILGPKHLSSLAGSKSSDDEEDGLEDGFSELETSPEADVEDKTQEKLEESVSDLEVSVDDTENAEADSEVVPTTERKLKDVSSLSRLISETPKSSIKAVLDQWVQEEKPLERPYVSFALTNLRKFKHFPKALQLMEWLQARKKLDFTERDYATHLDLITKSQGINRAENFIKDVPESFRGEILYRTLLANCCTVGDMKRTEEIFNKMRDLDFPLTAFACNQLLLLYKKTDRKKIADVLLMMEKENVKPNLFTYKLLIDTKGRVNDIDGMEQILETMKSEEIEPDVDLKSVIARHYILNKEKEKAVLIVKEMEGENLMDKDNREAIPLLLSLYATLDDSDEVGRIWGSCEESPYIIETANAIAAYGKLGQVDKAEEIYENSLKLRKRPSTKLYTTLLQVYGTHKLLAKGKELMKQISDKGCPILPQTWDALVKLYIQSGEIEKADSILQKARESKSRIFYTTYTSVLSQYAKRGDFHGAEKIFHYLRTSGYSGRMLQYQFLLETYRNAKLPAYGFKERMKAHNVFPNRTVATLLAEVDALKKRSIDDLLIWRP